MYVARMISMYHNVLNKTILRSLLGKKIYCTVNIKIKVDFITHMRMSYSCMNIYTSAPFNLQHMVNINKETIRSASLHFLQPNSFGLTKLNFAKYKFKIKDILPIHQA